MANAASHRYMGRVAELGCLICDSPANIHHIRTGVGMGQRQSDYLTIPLCREHHQGDFSIHADRRQFCAIYGEELTLLAETIEKLHKQGEK